MLEFFFVHRVLSVFFVIAFGFVSPSYGKTDKVSEQPTVRITTSEGRQMAEKIRTWFPDAPHMVYVANCESTGLIHHENGRLIRGRVDGLDEGVFQVRMPVHRAEMRRMGLNPNNLDHYFGYVRHLYDTFGLRPWKSSQRCWSKYHRTQPRG